MSDATGQGVDMAGTITTTVSSSCGIQTLAGGPSATVAKTAASDTTEGVYESIEIFSQGTPTTCELDMVGVANGSGTTNNQVQIVGSTATLRLAEPQSAFANNTRGGAPGAGMTAGASINKASNTNELNVLAAPAMTGREFMAYGVDSNNQSVLSGTGAAGTIAGGGLFTNEFAHTVMTAFDAVATAVVDGDCADNNCYGATSFGPPTGLDVVEDGPDAPADGEGILAGNQGWFGVQITAASLADGGTHTLTLTSGTATLVTTFTATGVAGAATTITIDSPAGSGADDAFLSPNAGGTNPSGTWTIQVDDANGMGVTGLVDARNLVVGNNAANVGALTFETAIPGALGAYGVEIGTASSTLPGEYLVDVTVYPGGVAIPVVETFTVVVAGPAASSSHVVVAAEDGMPGMVTFTFLDAAGNPVAGGSPVGILATGTGGILAPDPAVTTGGVITITYTAGTETILAQVGTVSSEAQGVPVVEPMEIEVGETVLDLVAGGQFVFATFSGNAADVFGAQVTIAWKFLGVGGGWISFFPDLGVTDYAIAPGDVLWVVSPMDQSILVNSG